MGWRMCLSMAWVALASGWAGAEQAPVENLGLLQRGPGPQRLAFRWDAPLTGPADHYQVYLNGDFQATVEWTQWIDGHLLPASSYTLDIRAVSATGEISEARTFTAETFPQATVQP